MTDARYRFERGVDPASTLPGLDLATRLVIEICGGSPTEAVIAGEPPETEHIALTELDRAVDAAQAGAIPSPLPAEIYCHSLTDPSILSQKVDIHVPAAPGIEEAAKADGEPADEALVAGLEKAGAISTGFNADFFKSADSTDPTAVGIWGALKGSLMTMLVTLLIAFPIYWLLGSATFAVLVVLMVVGGILPTASWAACVAVRTSAP